jgi:hypothetical protein
MKTSIIYLIAISFLFQSCYTYKAIDLKDDALFSGRNYKISQTNKSEKVKLLFVNDSTLVVSKNDIQKNIPISKITEIKEEKFSTPKTLGLLATLGLTTIIVVGIIAMSDFGIGDFTTPTN